MEDIKPKKERKFLKAVGKVAGILLQEFVLGLGRKFIRKKIDRIDNKRQTLLIFLALFCNIGFASIDSIPYPITGNKQRLGWQTTGNGLVWRGLASDTITKPTNYADKNVKAYLILDSVTGSLFVFKQGVWASVSGGSSAFTQPIDSLFFKTSVPTNNVDTAKMRWDSDLGTVVLGMYDKVPNELGFKNFWLVKNQTGSTITKGSIVYANGTVGASGRLTIAKFIANGTIEAKYLLGIAAHDLSNGEDGYVISYGKIRQVNTDTFAAGALLYPSPTVAGAWTDVEPKAPNINMPIGFCINSSSNNGTIAIRVASGYKIHELHDVDTTGLSTGEGLIYNGSYFVASNGAIALQSYVDSIAQNFQDSIDEITNGYFKQEFLSVTKDTLNWTKSVQLPISGSNLLLVYRNGQMLNDAQYSVIDTNKVKINTGSYKVGENYTVVYVKGGGGSGSGGVPFDTSVLNLQARLDLKLNISDTASMLADYATKAYADTTGRFYARQDFSNVSSATLTWTQSDTLITGNSTVLQVYRNGQILLPSQYTITNSTTITIASTSYKAGENYTVIFPRGGGAGSGGGSGSLTSISGGTGITVSPNPITTTGTVSADLSVLMELSDTVSLSNRINTKLNTTDTANLSNRINLKLNAADTASLSNRINTKQNTITLTTTGTSGAATLVNSTLNIPQYSGGGGSGTVTSVATGYGLSGGTITTTGTLVLDSAVVFSRIRDSIVDVAIGNDTIKILKQEYNNVTSDTLTWTITSKFPIQLRAYILLFRNGQLLINDQYSVIDTNKIKVASSSYKLGENYTIVTVSGIGSVSSVQNNPIYPEAGIALSTGTTWASSIPNNSTNWNTAYTDRLKWDGGSTGLTASTGRTSLGGTTIGQSMFTLTNPSAITFPQFNADNTITALSASSFRGAIGAGTVTSVTVAAGTPLSINNNTTTPQISMSAATGSVNGYLSSTDWTTFNNKQNALTNPVTGTGVSSFLPRYTGTSTLDSTRLFYSNGRFGVNMDASEAATHLTSRFVVRDFGHNFKFDGSAAGSGYTTTFSHDDTGLKINNSSNIRDIRFTLNGTSGLTIANNSNSPARAVGIANDSPTHQLDVTGTFRATGAATLGSTLGVTGATTLSNLAGSGDRMVIASSTGLLSTQTIPSGGGGTVTSVTGTAPISVATGTTTPVISVAAAAFGTAGIVTATGTQQFSGDKTFEGITQFNARAVFKDYTYTATRLAGLSSTDRFATVTLGTGLSLSSGTLSATNTGTVTNVTGTSPISVANGTTTPSITIADASASASGVVNTTTQSFAGNKTFTGTINVSSTGTFGGRVNTPWLERTYTYTTSSTISVGVNTTWLDINTSVLTTLTLPNAATYPGKEIHIRQTGAGSLQSASSNIIPFSVPPTGSTSTGILTASTHRSVTLVSDGTNWIIMQRSDI